MISMYIILFLLSFQLIGTGYIIGKIGTIKEEKYTKGTVISNLFISFLYAYVLWEIFSL